MAACRQAQGFRAAPLSIQGVIDENTGLEHLLKRGEIEDFICEQLVVGPVRKCQVDFEQGTVSLLWTAGGEAEDGSYYGDEVDLFSIDGWRPDDCDSQGLSEFGHHASEIWLEIEDRFRRALRTREWVVLARIGSPYAPRFTEISTSDFLAMKVTDWERGIAEASLGESIYSIHIARDDSISLDQVKAAWRGKQARVAEVIFAALNGKYLIDKTELQRALAGSISKTLRAELHEHCYPEEKHKTLAHETVKAAVVLARKLHACKPSTEALVELGIPFE